MDLLLITQVSTEAAVGEMTVGKRTFYSLELPYLGNLQNVSCVPAGEYDLFPVVSPLNGRTFNLHNPDLSVWGLDAPSPHSAFRTHIEIHSANWNRQLLGCIALGMEGQPMLDPMTGRVEAAVENSRDAIEAFLQDVEWIASHTLTIRRTQCG